MMQKWSYDGRSPWWGAHLHGDMKGKVSDKSSLTRWAALGQGGVHSHGNVTEKSFRRNGLNPFGAIVEESWHPGPVPILTFLNRCDQWALQLQFFFLQVSEFSCHSQWWVQMAEVMSVLWGSQWKTFWLICDCYQVKRMLGITAEWTLRTECVLVSATLTECMFTRVCLSLSMQWKNWVITVCLNYCWSIFVFFICFYFLWCCEDFQWLCRLFV